MSLFICGTDTDVGKTLVCSILLKKYSNQNEIRYWKPVQTGPKDEDLNSVRQLSGIKNQDIRGLYHFKEPLSPHRAAELEDQEIDFDLLVNKFYDYDQEYNMIIEGAGGLLVPLNREKTWLDFLIRSRLPVLLVARSGLGTINHSLMTLKILKENNILITGILFCGTKNTDNMKTVCDLSKTKLVGHIQFTDEIIVHRFEKSLIDTFLRKA